MPRYILLATFVWTCSHVFLSLVHAGVVCLETHLSLATSRAIEGHCCCVMMRSMPRASLPASHGARQPRHGCLSSMMTRRTALVRMLATCRRLPASCKPLVSMFLDSSTRPDNLSAPAGETPGGRMVGNRSEPFQLRIRAAQQ